MLSNVIKKELTWEGKQLTLETGRMAQLAAGAVLATYGGTQVLAAVSVSKHANPELDFVPLSVHYQEKYYAVGKIPGGFFKRETKPSEREVLISRLIDRPLRPMIDPNFKNEVQIIVMALSYDGETDTDVLALIASSAALALSGVPVSDVVAAAKVSYINQEFKVNPVVDEHQQSSALDLVVAGTKDGILMVESEAQELQEDQMLAALEVGFKSFQPVIGLIEELRAAAGKPELSPIEMAGDYKKLKAELKNMAQGPLREAFKLVNKQERVAALAKVEEETHTKLLEKFDEASVHLYFKSLFKDLEKDIVRGAILDDSARIDGRALDKVRPIVCELDVLNAAHGSALFTRGETQALVVTTLGSEEDEQIVDGVTFSGRDKFMLNYNFPPFSVGEAGKFGAPGRREVGHGKLAFRAISPVLPKAENEFPYTVRVVSEILQSNGSSSMATVCGTSLSLMAAGVPLKKPVAGIAMGLIKEAEKYAILSDILGDEDHLGDMDFKVAGTKDGITALQMDLKITSINFSIMKEALAQAKAGRMHILGIMEKTIDAPRRELKNNSPKIKVIVIDKEKIPEVIGSGGKVIKSLISTYGVKINVKDDGVVKIYGTDESKISEVLKIIASKVIDPEVGVVYSGKVVKVLEFGAFINFIGNKDGFLHISEITDQSNANMEDFIKVGDVVKIKVVRIDRQGKIRLTMKGVEQH